jgi:hypothetical protein
VTVVPLSFNVIVKCNDEVVVSQVPVQLGAAAVDSGAMKRAIRLAVRIALIPRSRKQAE